MKRDEHLPSWFGEPSLGRAKTLTVEYEINGSAGEMHEYELNGKLMYPMSVAASPSVAPQILIENASYGWTEELLDDWKARYHKDIFDMLTSASRGAAAVSRHLHESSPGMMDVGGLFFDCEPFRGVSERPRSRRWRRPETTATPSSWSRERPRFSREGRGVDATPPW